MVMIHLKFDATARFIYKHSAYATPPARLALITCVDSASYAVVPVDPHTSTFSVDLQLTAGRHPLVDTLKFHFFDDQGHFILASYTMLESMLEGLCTEKGTSLWFANHREPNITMHLELRDRDGAAQAALEAYHRAHIEPSALHGTERSVELIKKVQMSIAAALLAKDAHGKSIYEITGASGGTLFVDGITTLPMEGQYIPTPMIDLIMQPPPELLDLYLYSGMLMYCLIDTLHYKGLTVDEALAMPKSELAVFVNALCETLQRSNHECRYFPDTTLVPDQQGQNVLAPTEFFKRPLGEPFLGDSIYGDDCEGLGMAIKYLFLAFEYMAKTDPGDRLFPEHLIAVDAEGKRKLRELALKIGRMIQHRELMCKMIIMSCGAAFVGAKDGGDIGGHVTTSIQYRPASDADGQPMDFLCEGTNCTEAHGSEDANLVIPIKHRQNMTATVPLSYVANAITELIMTHMTDAAAKPPRFAIHLSDINRLAVYNTIFIQGDQFMATRLPDGREQFGILPSDLDNYQVKQPLDLALVALTPEEKQWFLNFCQARSREIHTPPIPAATLDAYLRAHWQPISLPATSVSATHRPHLQCYVSQPMSADPAVYTEALRRATEGSDKLNAAVNQDEPAWCEMRCWVSMGSLMTCMSVFTDNTAHIQDMVRKSIEYTLQHQLNHPDPNGLLESMRTPHA